MTLLSTKIDNAINDSFDFLSEALTHQTLYSRTHTTIIVCGWNRDKETRMAIAHYLVGLRAAAINAALEIGATFDDTIEDKAEIYGNVIKIVGQCNSDLSYDQKQDERNPWISEGIWHLCLALAGRKKSDWNLPGQIIAVNYPHNIGKDHEADVTALYEIEDLLGFLIVESKAYKNRPNDAISDAVNFFRKVNNGTRDLEIRKMVQSIRKDLPDNKQEKITNSFWKRHRTYVPNPHYDSQIEKNWSNSRPALQQLQSPSAEIKVVVMPHIIDNFDDFFDEIANEMRCFAKRLRGGGNV